MHAGKDERRQVKRPSLFASVPGGISGRVQRSTGKTAATSSRDCGDRIRKQTRPPGNRKQRPGRAASDCLWSDRRYKACHYRAGRAPIVVTSPQRTCDADVGGRGLAAAAALWRPSPFDLCEASGVHWRRSCQSALRCPALTWLSATCGVDDA